MKNDAMIWTTRLVIYMILGVSPLLWIIALNMTIAPNECWANDLRDYTLEVFIATVIWGCFSLWVAINWRQYPCRE